MPTPDLLDSNKEHTLILVKPDGFARGLTGEVLRRIEAKGYVLKGLKIKKASRELLEEHYAEHREQHFFNGMVDFMSSGPLVAIVVEGDRVIEGPGTIRGDLGRDWGSNHVENVVHGSDSPTSAEREIALWFPELCC